MRGGLGGCFSPAVLKVRFGADEVVTSLLLNFIVLIFVQMMLEGGAFKDPMGGLGWPQSAPIVDNAVLPQLMPKMRIHAGGFVIAIVLALIAWVVMSKTVWGACACGRWAKTGRRRVMRGLG